MLKFHAGRMSVMILRGDIRDLYSHCVALGLGSILESDSRRPIVFLRRTNADRIEVKAKVDDKELSDDEIVEIVTRHAEDVDKKFREDPDFSKGYESNSSRLKAWDPNSSKYCLEKRRAFLDGLDFGVMAHCLGGFGDVAYWLKPEKKKKGISGWQMGNANRGNFTFTHYYPKACKQSVELIGKEEALNSLKGEGAVAEGLDSSNAMGMSSRGTYTLQLWCALHSRACFPVRPICNGKSANTTGFKNRSEKRGFYLPIFNHEVTLARYKSILRSKGLYRDGEGNKGSGSHDSTYLGYQPYFFEKCRKGDEANTRWYAEAGILQ